MRRTNQLLGILAFIALGACEAPSVDGSGSDICAEDPTAEGCTLECTSGVDCPFGTHCGTDGVCAAECVVGTDDCGDGFDCGADGRCFEIGEGPDCPDVEVNLQPETPTVIVLVDQSGSMTANFGDGLDRYEAVRAALTDSTTGVVTTMGDRVTFGASLYMSQGGDAGGTCPMLTTVDPGVATLADIDQLFEDNDPTRDTPTAESIAATAASLAGVAGPKVIVLATDGDPDTCADPDSNGQDRVQGAVRAGRWSTRSQATSRPSCSASATRSPSRTSSGWPTRASARISTPAPRRSTSPTTRPSSPRRSTRIIRGVRSCEITLDQPVDMGRAEEGTVTLNGNDLDFGSDWELTGDTTINLLGSACDEFLNTDAVQLSASFPCGIVVD